MSASSALSAPEISRTASAERSVGVASVAVRRMSASSVFMDVSFDPAPERDSNTAADESCSAGAHYARPRTKGYEMNHLRSSPAVIEQWNGIGRSAALKPLERAKGFEPSTPTLARLCST